MWGGFRAFSTKTDYRTYNLDPTRKCEWTCLTLSKREEWLSTAFNSTIPQYPTHADTSCVDWCNYFRTHPHIHFAIWFVGIVLTPILISLMVYGLYIVGHKLLYAFWPRYTKWCQWRVAKEEYFTRVKKALQLKSDLRRRQQKEEQREYLIKRNKEIKKILHELFPDPGKKKNE